jgi:3',5'-cyclic AMP phosphodiesterase CpdA
LQLNNDPSDFQFVVISDRTGGHREKVYSRAVEQINLLQPEFVLSVGDLIEGYTSDAEKAAQQWREFQGYTSKLQMPFFYVAGNHDLANPFLDKLWQEKFGRRYYHFVYKDVLFLILCTEDPPNSGKMSTEQIEYVKKVLAENPNPRWTIVALHRPVWTQKDLASNGWLQVEKALAGRNYTVFAGHIHSYQKFVRNGMNYYQLATTGGSSKMRGVRYGEFDHVVWVTMKKNGPVLANILLDGIYSEEMKLPETNESVNPIDRKPCQPVKGFVYVNGCPAAQAVVVFHRKDPITGKYSRTADAWVEADGSFTVSTYVSGDGAPVGEYAVAVSEDGGYALKQIKAQISIPKKYANAETTPLKVVVKPGANEFTLELKEEK